MANIYRETLTGLVQAICCKVRLLPGVLALAFFILTFSFSGNVHADELTILKGTVVTMTSKDAIIENGAILINNGMIEEIVDLDDTGFSSNTDGAIEIETEGIIFPGLINIHNHNFWATLPTVPVNTKYNNRYEWQPDDNVADLTPFLGFNPPVGFNIGRAEFNPYVNYPRYLLSDPLLGGLVVEVSKYAEIKGLVGGTTTIEGTINAPGVSDGVLLRNAEHTNFGQDRVERTAQNITDPAFAPFAQLLVQAGQNGLLDTFLVHLAEGTDAQSLAEYDKLKELDLLQEWTVIVHGIPLTREMFDEMASAGTDLVWSPTSNLALYGQDARADQALDAGVNVSLGSDWGVSGPKSLLVSLKVAWELNNERKKNKNDFTPRYEHFSAYDLVRMVTVNPAKSLKWDNYVGQLQEGLYADILVIDRGTLDEDENDPNLYKALIDATEKNVRLVMVEGDALYGDQPLMDQLKPGDYEMIGDGDFEKAIDVTKAGKFKGTQTFAQIEVTLSSAMLFNPFVMYATFPVVQFVESLTGVPLSFGEFLFLFGYIFFDYLPDTATFPPSPADLGALLAPGALSLPLTPVYTSADPLFFDFINNSVNASFPDIEKIYYIPKN